MKGKTNVRTEPNELPTDPRHPPGRPDPPDWLNSDEVEHFERICDGLEALGKLTLLDRNAIACYVTAFSRWVHLQIEAQKIAAEGRSVIANSAGTLIAHPIYAMIARYSRLLAMHRKELFLSPASRQGMRMPKPPRKDQLKLLSYTGGDGDEAG